MIFYNDSFPPLNYSKVKDYLINTKTPSKFYEDFGEPNAHTWFGDYWELDNGNYLCLRIIGTGRDASYFFNECNERKVIKEICVLNDR